MTEKVMGITTPLTQSSTDNIYKTSNYIKVSDKSPTKPKIETKFDNIADKLKEENKWFNWEYGDYDAKKNKFAKKPCARFYDTYNPDKWLSFESAKNNCISSEGREGMAFVLKDSDYIFVDIDGIDITKDNGNILEIVNKIASYTERSIYGKGLHIIFEGSALDFPRTVINVEGCDHIEVYNGKDKRWFAITGQTSKDYVTYVTQPTDYDGIKSILNSKNIVKIHHNIDNIILNNDLTMYPPCILNTIEKLKSGDGTPHDARVNLVIFLKKVGLKPIEVAEFFKTSDDYDVTKTINQITQIYSGDYKVTYNCEKIKSMKVEKKEKPICSAECGVKNPIVLYIKNLKDTTTRLTINGDLVRYPFINELTEFGISEQFAQEYEGKLIYNAKIDRWYQWNGNIYYLDQSKKGSIETGTIIINDLRKIYKTIHSLSDIAEYILKYTTRIQTNASLNSIIKNMMMSKKIKVYDVDVNPNIYTTNNGTLDIDSMQFTNEFFKKNYCTKMMYVNYDETAKCPRWLKHLETIFIKPTFDEDGHMITDEFTGETVYKTDYDMIEAFQRSIGYTFANGQPAQKLFLAWGGGRNGKSETFKVIGNIFGDFAEQSTFKVISERPPNDTRQDLNKYKESHFLVIAEAQDNKSKGSGSCIDSALVKTITGGEKIDVRALYDNGDKGYHMRSKMWMMSNDLPTSNDNSYAFWRRILIFPFHKRFSDEEKIADYSNILLEEKDGIFQWIIEGYYKYKKFGLIETKTMEEMKKEYREDQDYSYEFINDKIRKYMSMNETLLSKGSPERLFEDIKTNDLYSEFKSWWEVEKGDMVHIPGKKFFYIRINKLTDVKKITKDGKDFFKIKIPSVAKVIQPTIIPIIKGSE